MVSVLKLGELLFAGDQSPGVAVFVEQRFSGYHFLNRGPCVVVLPTSVEHIDSGGFDTEALGVGGCQKTFLSNLCDVRGFNSQYKAGRGVVNLS